MEISFGSVDRTRRAFFAGAECGRCILSGRVWPLCV